jgi:hypothetical protein
MVQEHVIKYFYAGLNMGLQDIRNAWLLGNPPIKLQVSLHRGGLVYRLTGSRRRISYSTLKKRVGKEKYYYPYSFSITALLIFSGWQIPFL